MAKTSKSISKYFVANSETTYVISFHRLKSRADEVAKRLNKKSKSNKYKVYMTYYQGR